LIVGKIKGGDTSAVYFRSKTWLANAPLYQDQTPVTVAPTPERSKATMLLDLARAGGRLELKTSKPTFSRWKPVRAQICPNRRILTSQ